MDFELSDEQRLLRDTIRSFVDAEIRPVAREWEESGRYPEEIVATMREMGLFGLLVPEEYGGMAADMVSLAVVFEEISRGWMGVAGIIGSHSLSCWMIATQGTAEQKSAHLPALQDARPAPGAPRGRAPDRDRTDRARRGKRPARHRDYRPPGRRPLRRYWPQDLDHQRQACRPAARAGEDRSLGDAGAQGHVGAAHGPGSRWL
jgi:hypothetical protein